MNKSFWRRVCLNWQSLQEEASESIVDLERFRNSLQEDLDNIQITKPEEEYNSEIEEEFWGGL